MKSPRTKFQVFWLNNDVIITSLTFPVSNIRIFWCFVIVTSKWRHTWKCLMNLKSRPKNSPLCQTWTWSNNYLENNSSFFVFHPKNIMWHTENKRLPWQYLITIVIDKICKMTVKGVTLKSESFFQCLMVFWSYGGKTLGGQIPQPAQAAWG